MPMLTGLAADPRQPGYVLVDVDRRRFASLPQDALADLPLVVGRPLDARSLTRLTRLADVESAQQAIVEAALRLEREGKIQIAREGGSDYV